MENPSNSGGSPIVPRRLFLKGAALGTAGLGMWGPWGLLRRAMAQSLAASPAAQPGGWTWDPTSPISFVDGSAKQTFFNGDEPDLPHDALWDKDHFLASHGGIPAISEQFDVVVVGGGMAGLTTAYHLRDLKPCLLEGARNFGGNSRGESWGGVDYGMGAAYITVPDEGSTTEAMLKDLGILNQGRLTRESDGASDGVAWWKGGLTSPFWSGATDPARADEFKRAWQLFKEVRDHAFPDIPLTPESQITAEQFLALDRLSLDQWLRNRLGQLHPHIEEFVQEYCWSSFAADPTELSAAQGLNFLAADLGGDMAFPGGNAAISRALHERLKRDVGSDRLRAGSFVVDVAAVEGGVRVCYLDSAKRLRAIFARSCVMACPKFVARYLISGLSADQEYAMERIKYRAYLVANVLIRGKVASPGYDVFRLVGTGVTDPREQTNVRAFTDLIFANWAAQDAGSNTVLTLYKGLPYDGARQFAFTQAFYNRHRALVENSLPEVLKGLQIDPSAVQDIRMTRWGHALPVAATGLIASGMLERASAPIGGRIFFANQDSYANPAFESAVGTAEIAAQGVRYALGRK